MDANRADAFLILDGKAALADRQHELLSVAADFDNGACHPLKFRREVKLDAGLPAPRGIYAKADDVVVFFTDVLTAGEKTTIRDVAAAHDSERRQLLSTTAIVTGELAITEDTTWQSLGGRL